MKGSHTVMASNIGVIYRRLALLLLPSPRRVWFHRGGDLGLFARTDISTDYIWWEGSLFVSAVIAIMILMSKVGSFKEQECASYRRHRVDAKVYRWGRSVWAVPFLISSATRASDTSMGLRS